MEKVNVLRINSCIFFFLFFSGNPWYSLLRILISRLRYFVTFLLGTIAFGILKKCAAKVNMDYGIMPKEIGK